MADGYLLLLFASDRSCGSCTDQNIFVSRSVEPYNNDFSLPAFADPDVLTYNGAVLDFTSTIHFAATAAGSNVKVFLTDGTGKITIGTLDPTAPPYNITDKTLIQNGTYRSSNVIGINAAGDGLFAEYSGQVGYFNPDVVNSSANPLNSLAGADAVVQIGSGSTGIPDAFLSMSSGFVQSASQSEEGGPLIGLNAAFLNFGITPDAMSILQTGGDGEMLLFSADDGGSTDMYAVINPDPATLWNDLDFEPSSSGKGVPAGETVDTTNLYAWYEMDGNLNDSSGNGNTAYLPTTPFNGVMPANGTDRFGRAAHAFTFNGSTHYIGSNFTPKCDIDFSISVWVKPAQVTADAAFMGYQTGPSANPGLNLKTNTSGQLLVQAFYQAGGSNIDNIYAIGGTSLTQNQWHNVVYVHNGTTRTGSFYLNGSLQGTLANTGGTYTCSGGSPVSGPQQWWVGTPFNIGYGYSSYFNGGLDEVRFYLRQLTASEIALLAIP